MSEPRVFVAECALCHTKFTDSPAECPVCGGTAIRAIHEAVPAAKTIPRPALRKTPSPKVAKRRSPLFGRRSEDFTGIKDCKDFPVSTRRTCGAPRADGKGWFLLDGRALRAHADDTAAHRGRRRALRRQDGAVHRRARRHRRLARPPAPRRAEEPDIPQRRAIGRPHAPRPGRHALHRSRQGPLHNLPCFA